MPLYDYECRDCGNNDTLMRHMNDVRPPFTACSVCNGMAFRVYRNVQVNCFKPYRWDFGDGLTEVRTPSQEDELCKRHGVARLLSTDTFDANKAKRRRKEIAESSLPPLREDYERMQHKLGVGRETTLADIADVKGRTNP